jgi:hypothetical protein
VELGITYSPFLYSCILIDIIEIKLRLFSRSGDKFYGSERIGLDQVPTLFHLTFRARAQLKMAFYEEEESLKLAFAYDAAFI